jgi:hypothetical protein
MHGKRHVMYELTTRDIPVRSVLCVKRSVEGIDGAWAFGKEFISIPRSHDLPRMDGRAGAVYCIWWGEVNDDSDGPWSGADLGPQTRLSGLPLTVRSSYSVVSRRTVRPSSTSARWGQTDPAQ